jgi:hypothetical protein
VAEFSSRANSVSMFYRFTLLKSPARIDSESC